MFPETQLNKYLIVRNLAYFIARGRAVEIPCSTCPNWSYFIQDKLKILIYLSLDKYKICIKLIKFCISYFDLFL